jgi:hypothetical protein
VSDLGDWWTKVALWATDLKFHWLAEQEFPEAYEHSGYYPSGLMDWFQSVNVLDDQSVSDNIDWDIIAAILGRDRDETSDSMVPWLVAGGSVLLLILVIFIVVAVK